MADDVTDNVSEETIQDFLDAYDAADDNHNGQITPERFIALMVALGVPGGISAAQTLLQKFVGDRPIVTTQDYIEAVKYSKVKSAQIERYKTMFRMFDKKQRGWVSQKSMERGLRDMGITIEGEVKDKILDMHKDHGRISFGEFLRVQLKMPSTR